MFGVVFSPVHFGRGLFCYTNLNFFYFDNEIETNLIARSSHLNFYYNFKQNKPRAHCNYFSYYFLFIRRCCRHSEKASVLFLVKSFIGVFWRILPQVSQQLPCKTPLIFRIFSIILSVCCCHSVVYYMTKQIWNCVSTS